MVPTAKYSGLDVDGALRMWRSAERYQIFLHRFMCDYTPLVSGVDAMEHTERVAFAHKLAGAAGSMGLIPLSLAAKAYVKASHDGGDLQDPLATMKQEIAVAWDGLRNYFGDVDKPTGVNPGVKPSREAVASMLIKLIGVLSTDNPEGAEEVLRLLASYIDPSQLDALRNAIHQFNFREAEWVVQGIAKEFNISLTGGRL